MFKTVHDIDFVIAAFLIMAILYMFYKKKYYNVSAENKFFYKLLLIDIATTLVNILMNFSVTYTDVFPEWSILTLRSLFNIGTAISIAGLYKFLRLLQHREKTTLLKILDNCVHITLISFTIFSFGNHWGGYLLYCDESGAYVEGPLFFVISLVSMSFFIYIIALLFVFKHDFTREQKKVWVTFFAFDIAAIIINAYISFPWAMFCIALAMIMIQQTLISPEYVEVEKAYDSARAARIEADNANKAKGQFLANMSHEIRTPINAVLGMDTMILRKSKNKEILKYAMDIQSAGRSLLSLINDILDFSKIESGKMELVPVDYDLSSMVNDIFNMINTKAREKDLEFIIDVDNSLPSRFFGDDVRIRQILINLLTNAVKYTPSGRVTLSIEKRELISETNEMIMHFAVTDTGIGIKETDIAKLTQEFVRIEESRNRNIEGTGLGINIVISFLKMMESKLEVDSVYGQGSTFWFDLKQKITNKKPIGDITERLSHMVTGDNKYQASFCIPDAKLLVVDDNATNRTVFRSLLEDLECKIDEAESGIQCLSLVQTNAYDIIFMDHMMPEMDGLETFQHMKELGDYINANTPVVILTANAISGARDEYLNIGFDDYLSKPIDADKLEVLIGRLVPDEKKKPAIAKETETSEESLDGDLSDFPDIDGVDWKHALTKLKKVKLLTESVRNFYRIAKQDMITLQQMYQNEVVAQGAFVEYRIKVHAMKSNAATIGANHVAGLAKYLEYAARDEDLDTINRLMPIFEREWLSLQSAMEAAFETDSNCEKVALERSELLYFLDILQTAMTEGDLDRADATIEELRKHEFSDDETSLLDTLSESVLNIDDELCSNTIEMWKNLN